MPLECKKIHPCVLQDIGPLGPLPCSHFNSTANHSKQGTGYRWPCAIFGWLVHHSPCPLRRDRVRGSRLAVHPASSFIYISGFPTLTELLLSIYLFAYICFSLIFSQQFLSLQMQMINGWHFFGYIMLSWFADSPRSLCFINERKFVPIIDCLHCYTC